MSSKISSAKAQEYIDNYRKNMPPGSLRSAWINKDFIDAILALSTTHSLNGVRIYMARYTEPVSNGTFNALAGDDTMIIVPTVSGTDVADEYYDYANLCPPHCDEGD